MALATRTKVFEKANPVEWKAHRFGLTVERWDSLKGQNFWITGAGTGYGRCLAIALAASGARVFLTGRRVNKLEESIREMTRYNIPTESCFLVPADLTDNDQIDNACQKVRSLCPGLNGLVNNAAIPSKPGVPNPLQNDTVEYWDRMMRVNVTAPWLLARTILPHMIASGRARVLFMSSGAGWAGTSGFGIYNVTKAAINSLSNSMAEEYAKSFPDKDIQINTLVPGEARTEMNRGSTVSPYAVVSMALILLSHPEGGPNGNYFHRDGRHLFWGNSRPYDSRLI